MADDVIDIEEHDILDNPVLRHMFPDLSILKKEVLDYNDEVLMKPITINNNTQQENEKSPTIIIDETDVILPSLSLEQVYQTNANHANANFSEMKFLQIENTNKRKRNVVCANDEQFNNNFDVNKIDEKRDKHSPQRISEYITNDTNHKSKVKLNSLRIPEHFQKANYTTVLNSNLSGHSKQGDIPDRVSLRVILPAKPNLCCIDESSREQSRSPNLELVISSSIKETIPPWRGNKIILGSKSSANNIHTEKLTKQSLLSSVKVLVENLDTFLSKSSRFCRTCLILFSSNKALADHKNLIHPQLNNIQSNTQNKKSVNVYKKYKCDICDKEFCSSGNLLRHKRCVHLMNIKKKRTKKVILKFDTKKVHQNLGKLDKINNFKCAHCNNIFSSQQAIIDHMYIVLQTKTKGTISSHGNVNLDTKKITTKPREYYRCPVCSYYLKQRKNFIKHIRNEHQNSSKIKFEKVLFDPVCKHCSNKYSYVQSFNVHVLKYHLKQIKFPRPNVRTIAGKNTKLCKYTKDIRPHNKKSRLNLNNRKVNLVKHNINYEANKEHNICNKYLLKSVYFECMKCGVCFLSGKKAADHSGHADTVTNWKCSKCAHLFKKEEQNYHIQQHLFGNNFDVIRICENTYSYLLYKCLNCTTYFREEDFFHHYSICEMQSPDSAYCKACHILIDNKIKDIHQMHHYMMGSKELTNILVESGVFNYNERTDNKFKESFDLRNKQLESIRLNKNCLIEMNNKIEEPYNINHSQFEENELSGIFAESNVHISNEETDIIVIEKKDSLAISRTESRSQNQSGAEDVLGKSLCFMYCSMCQSFIFVNRVRKLYNHTKARCIDLTNYVCKYCGLVLSNKTIDSHRKLHQNVPSLTLTDFTFYESQNLKKICPPVPKYPNCQLCDTHFVTKTAILSHQCNEDYLMCSICKIKLSNTAYPLHMSFHNYSMKNKRNVSNDGALIDLSNHANGSHPTSVTKLTNFLDANETCESKYLLVYVCKICKVTVDTYDKVIEHCHYHIVNQEKKILTKPCDLCNLLFETTCFESHNMLHSCNQNRIFSVLTYDAFYVTTKDNVWHDHLFGSLSKKEINNILENSIYSFERKIKMQILQDGISHLTFYKCAQCNGFIDKSLLYKHTRINLLCYKTMLVPCTICGILLSNEFRIKHEKIHETQDVTVRSYRIVLFNSDHDKSINNILSMPRQYVLYECRNCNGIIDKKKMHNHKCDFNDLSKCSHCGLLLYSKEYMSHVVKHKEFCSYRERNIVVILLGAIIERNMIKARLKPSFKGAKLDYSVYKCNKCKVCLKDKQSSLKHDCIEDSAKTKCLICDLYFEDKLFRSHLELHECDVHFSKDNLTVVGFGLEHTSTSDADIILIDDDADSQDISGIVCTTTKFDNTSVMKKNVNFAETIVEKYDEIFRCPCGLNFLTEASALSHHNLNKCNPRTLKQTCSKCGLLFKPNILYSHLLKHHASKDICYKFNIIKIPK